MMKPIQYFNQGRLAREDGLPATACPLRFKAWPYDAWQLGWQLGDIEANVSNHEAEPLVENVKTPFEQGQIAFIKGIAFEDCPYDQGVDQVAWQAGYISQSDGDGTGVVRGLFNALKYTVIAAVIVGLMWAFINVTWPTTSGEQSDCQRNSPPWHSADCYEKPASP